VYEAAATVGGGARTEELTLPGFRHDPCSAVHPLGAGSPVLTRLPLARHGLRWVHPPVPLAHPLPDGSAAVLDRSVRLTMASLGQDAHAYRLLVGPFRGRWDELAADVLRPQLNGRPAHPVRLAKFGLRSALPTAALAGTLLRGPRARALLAGLAGHAMVPLTSVATSGIALLLAIAAHEVGWPFAAGDSQAISDALAAHLTELGGEIVTGAPVRSWPDLPNARAFIFDTSPAMLAEIAADQLPPGTSAGWRVPVRPRRVQDRLCPGGADAVDRAGRAPGPGVHGACGYHAALSVLERTFGGKSDPVPA
jgi:phytoene dehydrogenase-like protein